MEKGLYGAKQFKRVKQLINVFIVGATCLALVFFILMQAFPLECRHYVHRDFS